MKQKIFFISIFLTACSARQRQELAPPNFIPIDASQIYYVDRDAYHITLPTSSEVSINLPITDGGGPNGEIIVPMRAGQQAPFNGVLFNGPAVARVNVEFRAQQAQCLINRRADIDRVVAISLRDIDNLNASIEAQRRTYEAIIRNRDSEINRLYNYARNSNQPVNYWPYVAVGLAGITVGVVSTVTIYFLTR